MYIGGFSSVFSSSGDAVAAVGDTVVRNVSVALITAMFQSCSVMRNGFDVFGASAYGGSFSFYVGAYTWSRSVFGSSSSSSGSTNISGVEVRVQNASFFDSRSSLTGSSNTQGANSYGGSMSMLHVGAYAWSHSTAASSSSTCGATHASELSVHVSDSSCSNCSALSSSGSQSNGANSYGGSMSIIYIGAYAWSSSIVFSSSISTCGVTAASGLSVDVNNVPCSNCNALTISSSSSFGANSYGGLMSALYVGAYAWSQTSSGLASDQTGESISLVAATISSGLSVRIKNSPCVHCIASTTANIPDSLGANSYGGSMSLMYIGALAWSFSRSGNSRSSCGTTIASSLSVSVSKSSCTNCFASTTSLGGSSGASSYGGSISALYVGAYAWSFAFAAQGVSRSMCEAMLVFGVSVQVSDTACSNCSALSTTQGQSKGANSIGGSVSILYVGAYAWSDSISTFSSSTCGATNLSGVVVRLQNVSSFNSRALTITGGDSSRAVNSFGGSMSVLYIGAYAWSLSNGQFVSFRIKSGSTCGATHASELSVHVSDSSCSNCSALSSSGSQSNGANSYGGSMSIIYIGAYAWSLSNVQGIPDTSSSSECGATHASELSVHVSDSSCSNCSALSSSGSRSYGANSYGGSMSIIYIGAYAWSSSIGQGIPSNSTCGATHASGLSVHVSDSSCSNCSALSSSGSQSNGANSYGGSMSIIYIGAYAWSSSIGQGNPSISTCGATHASGLSVHLRDSSCSNCGSLSTSGSSSHGAVSYGGSVSASYIGAFCSSYGLSSSSHSIAEVCRVHNFSITIINVMIFDSKALSGEFCSTYSIQP